MLVSSADLIGTARLAALAAAGKLDYVYQSNPPDTVDILTKAEDKLITALAEVRAARWGVERRMPQFDDEDLTLVLANEEGAILNARGVIPQPQIDRLTREQSREA